MFMQTLSKYSAAQRILTRFLIEETLSKVRILVHKVTVLWMRYDDMITDLKCYSCYLQLQEWTLNVFDSR